VAGSQLPVKVLELLLQGSGHRSGQEMAGLLGCSRAAVAKAVAGLRAQGFEIQAAPRRGYRLISEPPLVLPARVEARLGPDSLGRPLYHFNEIDSTNLEARRRAESGAPHGACLVAEHQSAGRGRLDRRWLAPPETCLLFSLILRPRLGLSQVFALNNLISLALCRALEQHCGLQPAIKWPNDVYLDGKKLAGILTEFTSRAEAVDHVVVGVGLNVNVEQAHLKELDHAATSLRAASGHLWDRAPLLAFILEEVTVLYGQFTSGNHQKIRDEYELRSLLLGMQVRVREGEQIRHGLASGFAPNGALLLTDEAGDTITIHHGDVSLLAWES
jgi:BirA family transcriptional regulator, biotin operon repressor / biotin---[acetyl-CoA-carboxylase] ligase